MEQRRDKERLSFSMAIRLERFRYLVRGSRFVISYVDRGFYSGQIKRFLRLFPRQQMLFLKAEDLREHYEANVRYICEFLEVDPFAQLQPRIEHVQQYPPMSDRDRAWLMSRYRREIRELEQLLGWDCSPWLESKSS